ncbi:LysM peptidoglycan-binding domain-containing protein [Neobacillus niacini]|uniref:LysM peptidoglycan-binding domain-containing protein n=1 Tax=Neobacillus niacini TaxID=86668 RepID=UPI00052F56F8|nr:LysM peptidoglycan-binding domain-containing protein [Neobacillus niacini]KGM45305.1 hypothetical protein NP83_06845 [Neobacillus niacini]MEC1522957.1 LysM peptidoglycan-binding domain-containing protein [Neobacillus niacini]
MKRIILFLFGLLTIYVIYIDLTAGTLPKQETQKPEQTVVTMTNVKEAEDSFEAEVEPGETLISIVENHIKKPLPVSIDKLIEDFQSLNPGLSPEKIQIGSTYEFPDYSK